MLLYYNNKMLDPIFLTLLIFGFWISYWDIKKRKIKNYSVVLLILAGLLINFYFTRAFLELPLASFFNILSGIFLGVIVWLAGLWSAADAKLFLAINFLFPVTFYQYSSGYFPGLSLFINFSLPFLFFLCFQVFLKTNFQEKKQALFSHFKIKFLLHLLLITTAIFCLIFFVSNFLRVRIEYLLWLALLFLLFWFIEQQLKIKLKYFFISVLVFSLFFALFFDLPLFTLENLIFISIFFALLFLLFVILTLAIPVLTQSVRISNLKEGMIPAEMIVKEKGVFFKKSITFLNFLVLLRERAKWKPVIGFDPDGLELEEIKEIQFLYQKGLLGFKDLKISLTLPFAPILFFGAWLTYFFKGPFFS